MSKKMLIDATHAEETRVVVVDGNKVEEFDFETLNKRQLAGNIYLAKVTRVEPSLQAAFVDYGGNRHGFLAFAEIHPDYYQIPVADRKALLEEERALARAEEDEENGRSRRRPAPRPSAPAAARPDPEVSGGISGMDVVDLGDEETGADGLIEAAAPDRAPDAARDADPAQDADEGEQPYRAMDHASDTDDEIESIAEEDVAEEISAPRKPRARRYKIQEVIKVRQIMLVQVVKEERGNKGAALTTYLSLAGRYCVLMPNTARGGGISRKITQAADRKKLKEIASEIEVPEGAGLIIRTAGAKRTKPEIKRDYEYLMRLWEQVRELTLRSIAPAAIYEEGNLIKRTIRDLYSREIDEVLVEGAEGYRTAKDFMRMIMPSHAKAVQQYSEQMPLFAKFQVESYLAGMFNPVVQLKSGGYIVIGVTEALVAIDVNSGRATKEGSIEDTALKTNLEAADEVARQLRLRDLAGLIVIDFIDMEERKNNAAVEKRLKDKLKTDRARIQVGRISGFGLLEMSRQRLRPGMLESTTAPCPHCHGTGIIRSDDSLALSILRQLEEEGTRRRSKEVLLKAPVGIVNFLMNQKREHIAQIEARYGMSVRVEGDPALISPDYVIDKFKTATRAVPEPTHAVVSGDASLMGDLAEEDILEEDFDEDEAEEASASDEAADEAGEAAAGDGGDPGRKKKRRRRRRRKPGGGYGEGRGEARDDGRSGERADGRGGDDAAAEALAVAEDAGEGDEAEAGPVAVPEAGAAGSGRGRSVRSSSSRSRTSRSKEGGDKAPESAAAAPAQTEADAEPVADAPAPKKRTSRSSTSSGSRAKPAKADAAAVEAAVEAASEAVAAPVADAVAAVPAKPARARSSRAKPKPDTADTAPVAVPAPEAVVAAPQAGLQPDPDAEAAVAEDTASPKSKRKGWWSLGR
jgi:ribonuclease E